MKFYRGRNAPKKNGNPQQNSNGSNNTPTKLTKDLSKELKKEWLSFLIFEVFQGLTQSDSINKWIVSPLQSTFYAYKYKRLNKINRSREWGLTIVVFLEAFNLLDVVDVMLDFLELGKSFGWNYIPEVFLELHGQLDGIQWIKSVIGQSTLSGDT